jgi:hypothetical protein
VSTPALTLRYDEAQVRVVSEDRATLAWLEGFVCPSFERVEDASAGAAIEHVVHYVCDAARHDGFLRRAKKAKDSRPCFGLDTEVVHLPAWEQDGALHLHDKRRSCVLIVGRPGPGDVTLVVDPATVGRRLPLFRTVRELAAETWRRRPRRLQLHAAALAVDGEALLLAGPKHAGKTTLLVHALAAEGARYIANDRVALQLGADAGNTGTGFAGAGGVLARGMPTVVSLRLGTLLRYPRLLAGVPDSQHLAQLNDAEWEEARQRGGQVVAGDGVRFSPGRFCAQLGTTAVAGAPLGALLFCRIDAGVPGRTLERLSPAAARAELQACLYGAGAESSEPTVLAELVSACLSDAGAGTGASSGARAATAAHAGDDTAASLDALAARVPAYACRLGPGAYDAPADLRADLHRELLEPAR